jgi:hypothetical protein
MSVEPKWFKINVTVQVTVRTLLISAELLLQKTAINVQKRPDGE